MPNRMGEVAGTLILGLALASCSAEPAAPPPIRPSTSFSPPAPVPATTAEYQAALTALDQALTPPMDAVVAAGSAEAVQAAKDAVQRAMTAQIAVLADIVPPAAVETAHRRFLGDLLTAERELRSPSLPAPPPQPDSCGVVGDPLPGAKNSAIAWTRAFTTLKPLQEKGFQIGAFVKPDVPAAPVSTAERRAANGKVVQRAGPRGRGRLEITNAASGDVAISVVSGGDPKNPQATIYVHAGAKATLTGIAGTYQVYFKTGVDWDDARRSFTRNCGYEKFDQLFDQSSHWRISLEKSVVGNASTSDVPPF